MTAHPMKSGIGVTFGPRVILRRPELASLIGTVASEWANLESALIGLYGILMGVYLPRFQQVSWQTLPSHPVAYQVFDTIETFRLRLSLLYRLAEWCLRTHPSLIAELRQILDKEVAQANKLRNSILHNAWGVTEKYPDALIMSPTFGKQLAYKASDFNEAIDRIIAARKTVLEFETKVRKILGRK